MKERKDIKQVLLNSSVWWYKPFQWQWIILSRLRCWSHGERHQTVYQSELLHLKIWPNISGACCIKASIPEEIICSIPETECWAGDFVTAGIPACTESLCDHMLVDANSYCHMQWYSSSFSCPCLRAVTSHQIPSHPAVAGIRMLINAANGNPLWCLGVDL